MDNESNRNCSDFVDGEIQKLLKTVAHEEGFCEYQIENAAGSVKGDGYVGIINSIKIAGKDVENKKKTLHLVIKSASKSDAFRTEMPVVSAFEREIYVYDTIFPTFQTLEMEKGLELSYFAPKLYKVSIAEKSEAILMENLKEEGYKLYERKLPMDEDHVSLVMGQYGRFHAMSFALRDQHPEKFAKLVEPLSDLFSMFLKETFFKTIMHRCIKALELLDEKLDQEAVLRCQKFVDDIRTFLDEVEAAFDDYSVILHSDCWTNNMMFQYGDNNNPKKPTQVRFLDFQITKAGPPVLDLAYFFYACSSKEIINNFRHYMRLYYESLSAHLRKLGTGPEKVYPFSILEQQWKKFGKLGFLIGTIVIHVMLTEKHELTDLKDVAESGTDFSEAFNYEISNVEEYNDRIRHIILHLVENDFI